MTPIRATANKVANRTNTSGPALILPKASISKFINSNGGDSGGGGEQASPYLRRPQQQAGGLVEKRASSHTLGTVAGSERTVG